MTLRFHRGGHLRRWIGARFGGGFELGDRLLRRGFHLFAAVAVGYYLLPDPLVPGVPDSFLLLAALAAVLAIEAGRLWGWFEVPTLRAVEARRVASYAYFAVAIVVVLLVFPHPIASVAIVGTALVDPMRGELRSRSHDRLRTVLLPAAVYAGLAVLLLRGLTGWPTAEVLVLAAAAAAVAIAAEGPRLRHLDDDLLMTLAPAVVLVVAAALWPA